MNHFFDVEIAREYGMLEAVLLNHFDFWIRKNEANEQNFFDGAYWTYNSLAAFCELFPYVTEKQLRRALNHLREEGLIQTGNYSENRYDRTLWYAFTQKGNSICRNGNFDLPKKEIRFAQEGKCIRCTDKNADNNTDNEAADTRGRARKAAAPAVPGLSDCVREYEANIGTISAYVGECIKQHLDSGLEAELVIEAIHEAAANNARNWKYIDSILIRCLKENILTVQAFRTAKEKPKQKETSSEQLQRCLEELQQGVW